MKEVSFIQESTNHNIFFGEFASHGINTRKMGLLFIIIIIDFFGNKRRETVSI